MNSLAKGKRGEHEWCERLRQAGFPATRNDQGKGRYDNPDIRYRDLDHIHVEIK